MPENKLTIGFVFDDSLDKNDGVQQYITSMGNELIRLGHEVHYLVGETKRIDIHNLHSLSKNINVKFNGNRLSIPYKIDKKEANKLFRKVKFDILHIQMPYSPIMAGKIIKLAPRETKIIGTFHILPNSIIESIGNRLLKLMLKRSLKRFNKVLSVSKSAQSFLLDNWGIKSSVLPNVVDVKYFKQAKAIPKYESSLNIVFLGRLVKRKGCYQLLKALDYINQHKLTSIEFNALIIGKGPLKNKLEEFVRRKGLSDVVKFLGFVSNEDKARYLKSADLAIFPSLSGESFGIVLIEAMASSRGVILAGNNPGYASVMQGSHSQLVSTKDTKTFANNIVSYLENKDRRNNAMKWQKNEVNKYDAPEVAKELVSIYFGARKH